MHSRDSVSRNQKGLPMSTMTLNTPHKTFEYGHCRVKDFNVKAERATPTKGSRVGKLAVREVEVDGRPCNPSKRFWTSIQCRFGFANNIFRYFDHKEVFDRISEKSPNDIVRYCIEKGEDGKSDTLLAVTNPQTSTIKYNQLQELLGRYNAEGSSYSRGIVRSTHAPRVGSQAFQIAGDEFKNKFVIDTPIDGFGRPNIYLSLMRLICSNGAIGYSPSFRSEISTGKTDDDVHFALVRAMDGFNNEDGFAAIRDRFDNATKSWASVNEVQKLYKILHTLVNNDALNKTGKDYIKSKNGGLVEVATALPIFNKFNEMTGDITRIYGLANLDSLSVKRQRTLPTACKVYDLLNFSTEIATHQSNADGNRKLQAFVGDLISGEYDLEGTVDEYSDWRDFFLDDKQIAESMKGIHDVN